MKGNSLPFILIFSVIVIVSISIYFYSSVSGIDEAVESSEYENFVVQLDNNINEYAFSKNRGSFKVLNIKSPMETVCFVEEDMEKFSYPELEMQVSRKKDDNLFFIPEEFPSTSIEHFKLEKNPLCVNSVNGNIQLKLESLGNSTLISSENIAEPECSSIIFNKENNIDIVFLGLNYNNPNELLNEVYTYIETIENVEPFSKNKNKFNYYMITENAPCKILRTGNYIKCNNFELRKIASKCPNDFIVVVADGKLYDFFVRSSSLSNIIKLNTFDDKLVFVHEFGHGFGDLADEYVDAYYEQFNLNAEDMPNCDNKGCDSWNANPGCFEGCSLNYFYRPTKNSIMRNYREKDGKEFGPINEDVLNQRLGVYE